MTTGDALEALVKWYATQCDGGWEHQYGISIQTLDNPGWYLTVDLTDTPLQDVPFEAVEHQYENNVTWWRCWREGNTFHAACGAKDLQSVIDVFTTWASSAKASSIEISSRLPP